MPAPALVQLEDVGRLEPVRVGVRFAETAAQGSDAGALRLADAPLAAGTTRAGPFALQIDFERAPGAATGRVVLRNASLTPLRLDALVLGLRWVTPPFPLLRFLQHGWQSWSYTGARDLDEAGTPQFPSGPWLRGLHHALPEPPADRSGWHESHLVGVVGVPPDGPACLAGVLEAGQSFGLVYLRRGEGGIAVELELCLERILEPGESYEPEPVRLALGRDANVLLEEFADDLGRRAGARTHAPFQAGWCTWYHFFHRIDEATFLRNLDALVRHRDELGVEVVQLDDGYQRAVGDWLETRSSFPSGLAALAGAIHQAGFVPGLWTAPFCVVPESRL
ncbi:MAG: alpha-galactosidase, partial [Myxococcota bacterium]